MNLSQKRNCNGCKAGGVKYSCDLGYKYTVVSEYGGLSWEQQPIEPCYKPKTYKELCDAVLITTRTIG